MGSKTEVTLRNFFIFNNQFGPREGEELQKILYYYPITDNIDVQIKNVGLVEGIIQFTRTFKPSQDVNSLHTLKSRQLYFQPEKNYWMVMTLNVPISEKIKDGVNQSEYIEGDVQDNVYEAVLQQSYYMYRLFNDKFAIEPCDLGTLKTKLEHFFNAYLKSMRLAHADILNVFSGIQYLPLDKLTFLKVQCFVNLLECNYPDVIHTAFLYNDHLIWSGPDPSDMKTIYQYLLGTLLPANVETELQGGSMPRNSVSPFAALHHGRFITGPTNLKTATSVGKLPKVYLFSDSGDKPSVYQMGVYRALSASVCLFINVEAKLTISFFKELDEFINQQLTTLVCDIAEYCSKQVITPSNIPENVPRFIYFNKLNAAYKSTAHLDSKQSGNIVCAKDPLKIIADLNGRKGTLGHSGDTIVKTMNDYWVFAKNSNMREFYVVLQQKNASLIDVSDVLETLNAEMLNRGPRNHG